MSKRVFVTHQLPGERIHDLADHCEMNVWMDPGLLPAAGLREELDGCQGLICLLTDRVDHEFLRAGPGLRVVANVAVGGALIRIDTVAVSEAPSVSVTTRRIRWLPADRFESEKETPKPMSPSRLESHARAAPDRAG